MGLDVYVGPMERFYSRQWETILQLTARAKGETIELLFGPGREFLTPEEAGPTVEAWRGYLEQNLRLSEPAEEFHLSWPEGLDLEYWTDKPDWAGYDGLRCWTAYAILGKHNRARRKKRFHGTSKIIDRAIDLIDKGRLSVDYKHFLWHRDILLPGDHALNFAIDDIEGEYKSMGWIDPFIRCLDACNAMTWQASPEEVAEWGRNATTKKDGLENCAKFGFAVFSQAARKAKELGQPLILDY